MVFALTEPSHPDAQALIAALDADIEARYPGVALDPVDTAPLGPPRGVFLVGRHEGRPVACGGIKAIEPRVAEVKRMYVDRSMRRRGVARALLDALERAALERGFTVVRIETGNNQPEAVALYEMAGYTRIAPFGEYVGNDWSICFEKGLNLEP